MPKDTSKPVQGHGGKGPKAGKVPKAERDVKVGGCVVSKPLTPLQPDEQLEPLEPTNYASALRRETELLAYMEQLAELHDDVKLH